MLESDDLKQFPYDYKRSYPYCDLAFLRLRCNEVLNSYEDLLSDKYSVRNICFQPFSKTDCEQDPETFKIRIFNNDLSLLALEKKFYIDNTLTKETAFLSKTQVLKIINGDVRWLCYEDSLLLQEFYYKINVFGLAPKTVIDYTRETFSLPDYNIRITLDYNIKSAICKKNMFSPLFLTFPTPLNPVVMKIKWFDYLPCKIRNALVFNFGSNPDYDPAFSELAFCRAYN